MRKLTNGKINWHLLQKNILSKWCCRFAEHYS
jgi:hypothetical protein